MKTKQHFIIVDCETGGLVASENPITQIAMLAIEPETFKEINRFEAFVKGYDNLKYNPVALESTMISMNDINKGIDVEKMCRLFIEFCKQVTPEGDRGAKKPILVGHNIIFDIAFIRRAFQSCKKNLGDYVSSNNGEIAYFDTLLMAKHYWLNEKGHRLEDCLKRVGINLTDAHRAMNDVLGTTKLFSFFMGKLKGQVVTKTVKIEEKKEDYTEVDEMRKHFEF